MQKDKKYYDDFFDKYPVNVHDNPDRFRAVSELLQGRVLDVACGTGTLSDYYSGDYTGIDISNVAISRARKVRRSGLKFFATDLTKSQFFKGAKFDSAYIGEFLEHIEDDKNLFSALIAAFNPNSKIVITVPNGENVPDESHCRIFTVPQIRRDYSKYGKITFHNWSGFKDRILFSIDLAQKNENQLSLVMTVKNEAKGLETAILSTISIVDRIVISIDSLSSDQTYQIAKKYADEIKVHQWANDFSKARNFAQCNVKSPWILFLDGHEFLKRIVPIEKYLKSEADGILTRIEMEGGTSFMYPRIFRSHLKFENAVHNALNCKKTIDCPEFVIVHDRNNLQDKNSAEQRAKQRNEMIPRIMQDNLKKNPKDQRSLFNLGNWFMTQSEYKNAIKTYKKCLKLTPSPDEKYFVLAQIGICHQMLDHQIRAQFCYLGLERLIPNRWETKRLLGGIYIQSGNYKKALEYLVFAIDPNKRQFMYNLFGQDLCEIWDLIACCFSELKQPAKAIIAWQEAQKHTKNPHRKNFFATKIQLSRLLVGDANAQITNFTFAPESNEKSV